VRFRRAITTGQEFRALGVRVLHGTGDRCRQPRGWEQQRRQLILRTRTHLLRARCGRNRSCSTLKGVS
jgi:hypothetical protein